MLLLHFNFEIELSEWDFRHYLNLRLWSFVSDERAPVEATCAPRSWMVAQGEGFLFRLGRRFGCQRRVRLLSGI